MKLAEWALKMGFLFAKWALRIRFLFAEWADRSSQYVRLYSSETGRSREATLQRLVAITEVAQSFSIMVR